METKELPEREIHYVYGSCCVPAGRSGVAFWGVALVTLGGLWLLGNLELIPDGWGKLIFPALFIIWGLATLWSALKLR